MGCQRLADDDFARRLLRIRFYCAAFCRAFSPSSRAWQAGQRQLGGLCVAEVGRCCASQSRPSAGRCMHQQRVYGRPVCCAHWLGWPHRGQVCGAWPAALVGLGDAGMAKVCGKGVLFIQRCLLAGGAGSLPGLRTQLPACRATLPALRALIRRICGAVPSCARRRG